jgi:two-component system, cell cycle sensor histidine kinase and response regulator CckA
MVNARTAVAERRRIVRAPAAGPVLPSGIAAWALAWAASVDGTPESQKPVSDDRPIPPESSATILLVDDAAPLLQIISEGLEQLGYPVLAASHGEEALRIAAEHQGRIEVLLTDIRMPGMQGPELAARLAIARPEIRIIFMSGEQARDLAHGVVVLQKPFSREQLRNALRDALR